ncbi:MAG TPA: NUDIX hydrolase [Streptosporangiaceae bacterium]|jgi:8-oxo-dGTP pyrophosphatase MutT (NUDIX family)
MRSSPDAVRRLVSGIAPADETERAHRRDALAWLAGTGDIYRRARPATPPKHLVSYAVLLDPRDASVFLGDHVLAGLCLPPGGHVEPGEDPADTVRREAREELGIEAGFSAVGDRPVFVTVTPTAGLDGRHTDVSLWYVIAGHPGMPINLDRREFTGGRWWTAADIEAADPARFDPHLGRFIAKVRSPAPRPAAERPGTPG